MTNLTRFQWKFSYIMTYGVAHWDGILAMIVPHTSMQGEDLLSIPMASVVCLHHLWCFSVTYVIL